MTRISGINADSGSVIGFIFNLTPFRHFGFTAGIGFDTRQGVGSLQERIQVGARGVLFDYTRQRWWNIGAEADVLIARSMDTISARQYVARARLLALLNPIRRLSLSGFAGMQSSSAVPGDVLSAQRTVTWGGGIAYQVINELSVIGEYSNGIDIGDPTLVSAIGGVRVFPWNDFSLTLGYGNAWRADNIQQPVLVFTITQGTGLLNFRGADAPLTASDMTEATSASMDYQHSGTSDSARGGIPVTMSAFAVGVQSDRQISHVMELVRPQTGVPLFQVLDSLRFRAELMGLNGDSARILQVTGTESASTEAAQDRIAARADVMRVVQNAGFPMYRVVFRDQYSSHRSGDPIAFGLFESTKRAAQFTEVVRVEGSRVEEAFDSVSSVLSAPSLAQQARIMVIAQSFGVPELKAAYTLQDMMYSQSLFSSYSIDIVFRKVDFGPPLLIIQTSP